MELRLTLIPKHKESEMIVDIIVRTCPECASENIVRNGHDYKGTQKYHCHDCGAYGTLGKKTDTAIEQSNKRQMLTSNG
jgi:transposase-like protein